MLMKKTLKSFTEQIDEAARIIKSGGVIAFPTETVYGLGANAFDREAVNKIFAIKKRPQDNPLIVHIAKIEDLPKIVDDIPPISLKLAKHFWPGPLSIIFPKKKIIPDIVSAGLSTIAVRIPDNAVAIELIKKSGVPIAAPSANISGKPSATHHKHVLDQLGSRVDMIIEAGQCKIGLESTVINTLTNPPTILRLGGLSTDEIEEIIGKVNTSEKKDSKPLSPGMKYKHYAPMGKVILLAMPNEYSKMTVNEICKYFRNKVLETIEHKAQGAKNVGIITTDRNKNSFPGKYFVFSLGNRNRSTEIASNLFKALNKMDEKGIETIIIESFPKIGLLAGVMERLERSSAK